MSEDLCLNESTIKEVNSYVNQLSHRFLNEPNEIKDFKEEIKSNLLISVKELMEEGYEEEVAVSITLNRFGDINEISDGMKHLYNLKGAFEKWLLKVAIILGIIGFIMQVGGFYWEQYLSRMEVDNIFDIVHSNIGAIENPVTKDMEDKLEMTFKGTILVKAIGIEKMTNISKPEFCYLYPKDTIVKDNQTELKNNLIFQQAHWNDTYKIPNTNDYVFISLTTNWFSNYYYIFAKILLVTYWILFILWASVEVMYNRQNKVWILLFVLLNFIGYFIYRFVTNLSVKKACIQ